MEVSTRVKVPDGRVGNVVGYGNGLATVALPEEVIRDNGRIVAAIVNEEYAETELEEEWLEGPDVHNRYWDQDGNQVVFQPDGTRIVV